MPDIPLPTDTDSEDVVWGLQTADTLWRRGERIDALVWLRRAAQAAGDSNDDDRALELARHAAELTDFMNSEIDSVAPSGGPAETPVEEAELSEEDLVIDEEIEVEVPGGPSVPPPIRTKKPSVPEASEVHAGMYDPWADMTSKLPVHDEPAPPEEPTAPPPPASDEEVITSVRPNAALSEVRSDVPPASSRMPSAPPAPLQPPSRTSRQSFGGMKAAVPPPPKAPPPPVPRKPSLPKPSVPKVASARPVAPPMDEQQPEPPLVEMSVMPDEPSVAPAEPAGYGEEPSAMAEEAPSPFGTPEPEAPLPMEASPVAEAIAEALERGLAESMGAFKAAAPLPETEPLSSPEPSLPEEDAPLSSEPEAEPPPEAEAPPPPSSEPEAEVTQVAPLETPELAAEPGVGSDLAIPSIPPAHVLDLEPVEAFSDMPDDVRETFAAAATIHELNEGDEIATFALAYVMKGTFEVAATMVDAAAGRLEVGQVLRSRGTTEENVPIRMIAVGGPGVIATWSDASVEEAFRTIPWVEDDLRAAADKMQTLVGITIGPLGERLDMSIREQVISKLKMRPLIPSEIVVNKGETVPGLLLVGIDELELMKGDEVAGVVGSGEFLFPTEVLGMGDAPYTARAGKGGALVMFGDRGVAQELLVTCPPLLEVFAGM